MVNGPDDLMVLGVGRGVRGPGNKRGFVKGKVKVGYPHSLDPLQLCYVLHCGPGDGDVKQSKGM